MQSIDLRAIKTKHDPDVQFFATWPTRFAHIRKPRLELGKTTQRAVQYVDECEAQFQTLGDHERDRRRIILWRVPPDNFFYNPDNPQILKIPFLLFSDETIEDNDETLLPIIHSLMIDQAVEQKII